MKRNILVLALVINVLPNLAQACEMYQALFHATARAVEALPTGQCRVFLSWENNWSYSPAYNCPLDIDEVSSGGVITSCEVKVGDLVSGMAYRKKDAYSQSIYLY